MPPVRAFVHIDQPYLTSRPHHHPTWEISLYTAGDGRGFIGDHLQVPISPGTIVCYPPDIPHWEIATTGCMGYFIHVDTMPQLGHAEVPTLSDRDRSIERLAVLLKEERRVTVADNDDVQSSIMDVVVGLLRRWSHPSSLGHPLVEQLLRILDSHICDGAFRITDALESLPLSRDHMRRLFIAETGKTPGQHLAFMRMRHASQLLRNGHRVHDVAAQVGFDDPYYFSRAYLRVMGRRPSAEFTT